MAPSYPTTNVIYAMVLAIVLQLVPIQGTLLHWKPNFILLVVIVLIINYPHKYGLGFAALMGLLADGIFGTTLGHFMFVFTLCGGILELLSRWTHYFELSYRIVAVFLVTLFAAFTQTLVANMQGISVPLDYLPGMTIISALLLPLIERFIGRKHETQ